VAEADPRADALLARITALEESGSAASENASELKVLRQRLDEVETGSGNGSDPRVGELAARLAALEERDAGSSGGASSEAVRELVGRLDSLEARLSEASGSDPRVSELAARLSSLERHPSQGGADPRVDEVLDRLANLEQKPSGGVQAAELATRLSVLEKSGGTGSDPRVDALIARLETLEQGSGSAAPDKRVTELVARLDGLERAHKSGGSAAGLDALTERVRALEAGAGSGSPETLTNFQAEFRARYEDLQHRLHQLESPGPSGEDVKSLIHKESERWTQWARNTLGEIGDLRQRIEKISQSGGNGGVSNGGSSGGDASLSEAMKTLGDTISESLGKSVTNDVKALRSQMYFVFFTIGMLYALGAFFTYIAMSHGG
jgi:hypothetical protein